MKMRVLALCFLACTFLSCSRIEDHPKQVDQSKYFPMSVGNKWEYDWDFYGIESLVSSIIGNAKYLRVVQITEESEGNFYFEESNYMGNLPAVKRQHIYELRNDMLMLVATGGGFQNNPMKHFFSKPMLLKFPLDASSSWRYKDDEDQVHNLRLVKIHDTVKVLGKPYTNVIEVSDSIEAVQIEYNYYAYEVGLIKVESIKIDPESVADREKLRLMSPTYKPSRRATYLLRKFSVENLAEETK